MIFYRINDTDRSADVAANTLRIQNQIQQRTDSCNFKVFQNAKPSENQDIRIYDGGFVSTHVTVTIVLKDSYQVDVLAFRAGQEITLKIGDSAEEKATVLTYTESTRTIVLTAAPAVSLSADDQVGELIFGGTVNRVQDQNIELLENIEYKVTGIDYTKIFDKKVVADTWEDVDSRYIINSFVNSTVNFNSTIDDISFANNAAIQAEWIESSDGNNPTVDTTDFIEAEASGVFGWTNSGGTALWEATPTSKDISDFVGATSGAPTKGLLMNWFSTTDQSLITTLKVRLGSDSSNYAEFTITLSADTDFDYHSDKFTDATIVGTPVWTATDYAALQIVQTGSGSVKWNGLRVNDDTSFTLNNVETTPDFDDLRAPQIKPTELINQIAKNFNNNWYIDYERDIHFVAKITEVAPFSITDTSDNFTKLSVECDTSNIGNRIIVRGGEKTSDSLYAQVVEGDDTLREWLMKTKYNNMTLTIDNNSSTDTMEGGTTTTTVVAAAHGLLVGDHIVNRTRSNAVRQVLTVPGAGSFTVEAVPSQASGDTFSLFSVTKTLGIEGIADETTVDYVTNSNEKSVRATASEATLVAAEFIRFSYNERIPIQVRVSEAVSIGALKALGLGDGVFDLDPVTDRNIVDTNTALVIANARLNEFANAVVTGTFTTDQKGLRAGQLLRVTDTTSRNIDDDFVIQKVTKKQDQGEFRDYLEINVTFATTLFGWVEFMQKLLRTKDSIELNVDDVVETFATADETVESADVNQTAKGGIKSATQAETVESPDVNTLTETTPPWPWEPEGVNPIDTRWDLFEWG